MPKKPKKQIPSENDQQLDEQLTAIAERNRDLTKALKKILSAVKKN